MQKYLVVYHASGDAMAQMAKATPEQSKAGMAAWMEWAKTCGPALVDLGTPLARGKAMASGGTSVSKKEVCGYSVMQGESMDAVVALLKKHPHFLTPGQCSIEVHEALALPAM